MKNSSYKGCRIVALADERPDIERMIDRVSSALGDMASLAVILQGSEDPNSFAASIRIEAKSPIPHIHTIRVGLIKRGQDHYSVTGAVSLETYPSGNSCNCNPHVVWETIVPAFRRARQNNQG